MPVVRRALTGLLGILASLVGLVAVSSATGGPLTWVVTEGTSMLPTITPGTLSVLQRRPSYDVGDVVGYRNADLASQVVLHRVVEVDGTLRLQGDNNAWVDPYRPRTDEVLGEELFAVPALGSALGLVREPLPIAVLGGLATLLVLRGGRPGRRTRSAARRTRPSPPPPAVSRPPALASGPVPQEARPARHGLATTAGAHRSWGTTRRPRLAPEARPVVLPGPVRDAAAVGLAVSLLALCATALLPSAQTTTRDQPVQAAVAFGYQAQAPRSVVYADGAVDTGEPVFLDVVDEVVLEADLDVVLPAGAEASGTWRLSVDVGDANGWSTTAYAARPVPLTERHRSVRVRPHDLLALADRAAALTGLAPGARTLSLTATVSATARRGAATARLDAAPVLKLQLEPKVLRLVPDAVLSGGADAALPAPPVAERGVLVLGPLHLPTATTRLLALVVGAACLLLLAAAAATAPWRDDTAALRRRHPGLLVPTGPLRLEGPVVEVGDLTALARIATRYERFIMVCEERGERVFVVQDDGTTYRCSTPVRAGRGPTVPAPRQAADDAVRV